MKQRKEIGSAQRYNWIWGVGEAPALKTYKEKLKGYEKGNRLNI